MTLVKLVGGPYDGVEVVASGVSGCPLNVTGNDVPDGLVALYRQTLDKDVWQFRGFSKIVATLPLPGESK